MKFCIVGAGAIGGLAGAWLARAGHEVSLVARGEHLAALRARGLTLETAAGRETFKVAASDDPGVFGHQDAVFIGLKAYSIPAMLPRLAPLLGAGTAVVPAINGLPWWYFHREGGPFDGQPVQCLDPGGGMLAALDPRHILGCVVHAAAEVVEPGVVRHTAENRFILGEPDRSLSERARRIASAMQQAGFNAPVSADIRQDIWMKLIGNLSYNPIAALTLAWMQDINGSDDILAVVRVLMEETMRVAQAHGIVINMSVDERITLARRIGNSKISMHQDVERRRPLEIDAITGAVLELGRKRGVETPAIRLMHTLLVERARHL